MGFGDFPENVDGIGTPRQKEVQYDRHNYFQP